MSPQFLRIAKAMLLRNRDPHSIPVMDGNLSPNDGLEHCEEIARFDDQPDDIAFGNDGAAYVSAGRTVLRASAVTPNSWETFAAFDANAGGLCVHDDGRLLVCVSGEGLAAVTPAGDIGWLKAADGVPIRCATAVAAAGDGAIYLTEGSAANTPEQWTHDLMQGNASGRLIRCDADLGNAMTLCGNLAYPHGCMMTGDQSGVIYSESWAHTVSRRDRDAGRVEKILRNLPGFPARLADAGDGTIWLSVFGARTHLVELVLKDRAFRTEMMRQIEPRYWIAPALRATGSYLEPLQGGGIKKLGIIKPWAPPRSYGLVMRIDGAGEILESLHSRVGGSCHGVTAARPRGGKLYIVSKGHQRLLSHRVEEGR